MLQRHSFVNDLLHLPLRQILRNLAESSTNRLDKGESVLGPVTPSLARLYAALVCAGVLDVGVCAGLGQHLVALIFSVACISKQLQFSSKWQDDAETCYALVLSSAIAVCIEQSALEQDFYDSAGNPDVCAQLKSTNMIL